MMDTEQKDIICKTLLQNPLNCCTQKQSDLLPGNHGSTMQNSPLHTDKVAPKKTYKKEMFGELVHFKTSTI